MNDLLALWGSRNFRDAVRQFDDRIPSSRQPAWAVAVLDVFRPLFTEVPEVEAIRTLALQATRWPEAHAAFDQLRKRTLAAETDGSSEANYAYLILGELVAKLTYNACREDDGFRPGQGLELAGHALAMASDAPDPDLLTKVRQQVEAIP